MKQQETYLTINETASLLKVSRFTLHRLRIKKKLLPKKVFGLLRYKLSDIEKAMK